MLIFQINKVFNLDAQCQLRPGGIAHDGCSFYISFPKHSQIMKFDRCFNLQDQLFVCRRYSAICYDPYHKCFWGATDTSTKIYRLDGNFTQVGSISVSLPQAEPCRITGLSCCGNSQELLVAFDTAVVRVDKAGAECPVVLQVTQPYSPFKGVAAINGQYLTAMDKRLCQLVTLYSSLGDADLQACLPDCLEAAGITTTGYSLLPSGCYPSIYILATDKGCHPCILQCHISTIDDGCGHDCPPTPPCPDYKGGCADIIESIALIETALSHIINAEGEKIQKAIACSDDVKEIMQVNESVNKTIVHITHLEQVLLSKLQLAQELCDKPVPCQCDCCNDDWSCRN